MSTLQSRINSAFNAENARRKRANDHPLRKTDLWKAAGLSSGACSHWFDGSNEMDLATAFKVAPLLKVNPYWLYDESSKMDSTESTVLRRPDETHVPELTPAQHIAALADYYASERAKPGEAKHAPHLLEYEITQRLGKSQIPDPNPAPKEAAHG